MRTEKEEPRSSQKKARILVKLSGEALAGEGAFGLDPPTVARIARDLGAVHSGGHQVAVVVGGGNFFRGVKGLEQGIDRARGDSIGMLATLMNALALEGALESLGFSARTQSAVPAPSICESYSRQQAAEVERAEPGTDQAHVVVEGQPAYEDIMAAGINGRPHCTNVCEHLSVCENDSLG